MVNKIRKVRSDKKREVKPVVSAYIKNNLYTLGAIVGLPIKDTALIMIQRGFYNDEVMREFQPLMLSNFDIDNRIYVGNRENGPIKINYRGAKEKVTIKFPGEIYETLRRLAFSVGLTPTSTAALMLKKAMFNESFMDEHKRMYLAHIDNDIQARELEKFIRTLHNTIPKSHPS